MCGKRLKALLPTLVPALERHGHLTLDPRVREQLMAVSAATIDRRLASARAVTAGQRRRRRSGGDRVRGRVPVRTFGDWQDPASGLRRGGPGRALWIVNGRQLVWTLVLTDIASGWTECVPLLVREAGAVVDAVDRLRGALPFPLRGIDTDNGSEFLNEVLIGSCKEHGIELTRSRPYRKNDQAWVEQKNGAVVRRLVGYGRLEGMRGAEALARLYSAARLFVTRGSDGSYGPCGPAWPGCPGRPRRPRDAADRRIPDGAPDRNRWSRRQRRRRGGGLGAAWSAWCRVRGDFGKGDGGPLRAEGGRAARPRPTPTPTFGPE